MITKEYNNTVIRVHGGCHSTDVQSGSEEGYFVLFGYYSLYRTSRGICEHFKAKPIKTQY